MSTYVIGFDKRGHFAHNINWEYRPVKLTKMYRHVHLQSKITPELERNKIDSKSVVLL
jgi:hypothetical protein